MVQKNNEARDFLGVTRWHDAGYTGRGVLAASGEDFLTPDRREDDHATKTMRVFREFAPDAELLFLPSGRGIRDEGRNRFITESIPQIKERGVQVWWSSVAEYNPVPYDGHLSGTEGYCKCFAAIGNDGDERHSYAADNRLIYSVGALFLNTMQPAYYTSRSEHVDFAAPTNIYISEQERFPGTSCSTPVLAGMACLVDQFFMERTGRPLSSAGMYQFFKDHSVDVGAQGKDTQSGWGLVILPAPEEIDVGRYQEQAMYSSRNIDDLRPDVAANCRKLIAMAGMDGYPVLVTGTVRDDAYQHWCYLNGTAPTDDPPSFHAVHAGLAFDICKNIKGQEWDDTAFWNYCGALGKKIGFTWGGDWKGFIDRPHFQWDDNGRYTASMVRRGEYPPAMPLYEEEVEEEMTKEEFSVFYDALNPVYATLEDVPDYWQAEARALVDAGKLKGDGTGALNIRHETLRAVIIAGR